MYFSFWENKQYNGITEIDKNGKLLKQKKSALNLKFNADF